MRTKNKNGKLNATTLENAAQAAQEIRQIMGRIAGLSTLRPTERKRLLKMRTGSEHYVRMMARLAQDRPLACPPGLDPPSMLANLDSVEHVAPLRTALDQALRTVDDTILIALSRAYSDALDVYGLAQRQVRRQPDLYSEISPFEAFLKIGARSHPVESVPPATSEPNGSDAAQ